MAPFSDAPVVHPFRHPSFHAQQLRALDFAKTANARLLWITAYDKLVKADETHRMDNEVLRKERWLEIHDRFTGGIPGLLPLVLNLPVRFTDTPNATAREMGVFKNARGKICGWQLCDDEKERIDAEDASEIVLRRWPTKIFVEVETATSQMPLVDGKRVYTLKAMTKPWSLDGQGQVKVVRTGFSIVPDFGGTAHAYCGSTLNACIGDLLPWYHKPRRDDALRGYIIMS